METISALWQDLRVRISLETWFSRHNRIQNLEKAHQLFTFSTPFELSYHSSWHPFLSFFKAYAFLLTVEIFKVSSSSLPFRRKWLRGECEIAFLEGTLISLFCQRSHSFTDSVWSDARQHPNNSLRWGENLFIILESPPLNDIRRRATRKGNSSWETWCRRTRIRMLRRQQRKEEDGAHLFTFRVFRVALHFSSTSTRRLKNLSLNFAFAVWLSLFRSSY